MVSSFFFLYLSVNAKDKKNKKGEIEVLDPNQFLLLLRSLQMMNREAIRRRKRERELELKKSFVCIKSNSKKAALRLAVMERVDKWARNLDSICLFLAF